VCAREKPCPIQGEVEPLVGEAEIFAQAATAVGMGATGRPAADDSDSIAVSIHTRDSFAITMPAGRRRERPVPMCPPIGTTGFNVTGYDGLRMGRLRDN
jgi:hypothetical protein